MATVVMTYPRDGGTYGTNADGSLVPFVAVGYVDVPGQVVSVYEDATSALLGSAAASSTPDPSGPWAGWYPWAIPISSWTTSAGALLPVMPGGGAMDAPSITGTHPILPMAGAGGMADTDYTTASAFSVPAMGGKGAAGGVGITAVASLPVMSGAGAMDAPSITEEAGGSGITYVGAGTAVRQSIASGGTLTVPVDIAGLQVGDVLVCHALGYDFQDGTTSVSAPAGWTDAAGLGHKRATATETGGTGPAFTVFSEDSESTPRSSYYTGRCYAFRLPTTSGAYLDGTVSQNTTVTSASTATGTAKTTTTANAMAVFLVTAEAASVFSSPSGSVDTLVQSAGSGNYHTAALAYDDAPSNSAGAKAAPSLSVAPNSFGYNAYTLFLRGE